MIDRNFKLDKREYTGKCSLFICETELSDMYAKWGGEVHVRITKPEDGGTEQQNRAMHALMTEFFLTGLHSAPETVKDPDQFKLWLKFQIGVCYEWEHDGRPCLVPKSWAKYTKRERREFIDALISMVNQSGAFAESEKIRTIIEGMQEQK